MLAFIQLPLKTILMQNRLFFTLSLLLCLAQAHAFPLRENCRTGTFTPSGGDPISSIQRLRMNLYEVRANSKNPLLDGTLSEYAPNYSNKLDGMDARKLSNYGLNISILRENTNIIIERRHTIDCTDTISFKIWGAQKKTYQMEFIANSFDPRLECVLEDQFLKTKTAIHFNDSTKVRFDVTNDPGSSDQFRFRVVFNLRSLGPLPITFTSLQVRNSHNLAVLSWKTENENNIAKYLVERSADGLSFSESGVVDPRNGISNSYEWKDPFPLPNNYYRIKGIEKDGNSRLSNVVSVRIAAEQEITIFPNPASMGTIHLKLCHLPTGKYRIRLLNHSGQVVMTREIWFEGFSGNMSLTGIPHMAKGLYHLELKKPTGDTEVLNLLL
jgi:hypothetical protein